MKVDVYNKETNVRHQHKFKILQISILADLLYISEKLLVVTKLNSGCGYCIYVVIQTPTGILLFVLFKIPPSLGSKS
jgi:hypothetical protein